MQSEESQRIYLEPTQESGRALFARGIVGPVFMLNLICLRTIADYSASPELAPASPVSGAEAFDRYIEHTLPYLKESGGEVVLLARGGTFFIGPENERWDVAMIVRQSGIESFVAFASNADYLTGLGHRSAAIEDSRLLPLEETSQLARD
jgi:hypothetical protein